MGNNNDLHNRKYITVKEWQLLLISHLHCSAYLSISYIHLPEIDKTTKGSTAGRIENKSC